MDNLSTMILTMDNTKIWQEFLNTFKAEVSEQNFNIWFKNTDLVEIAEDKIILSIPNAFFSEQLRIRYLPLIESTANKILGRPVNIELIVDPSKAIKKKVTNEQVDDFFQIPQAEAPKIINPKFTLENFVVGLSNNVAFAAAQAVAQNPGTSYNPLFFYGGTGVGKTHLMLGIGNAVLAKNSNSKIIYCSSEKFTNDYVDAIRTHRMGDFRNKYRSADILLLDDIQFFSGREGTQEEFFHTFNELQGKGSQMVLTSDRSPNEIAKLEDRLKSRFVGGLMVDIQQPDFDTRVAILRAKCLEHGDSVPEEALQMIAQSSDTNIRELEGKLIQILQTLKVQNLPFTIENISQNLGQKPRENIIYDHKKVINTICTYFNLTQKELTGPKRQKELVLPRHITMFILSEQLNLTVERIGQILGGRDHTTVMHGRDKIKQLINNDREVQRILVEVKQRLIA